MTLTQLLGGYTEMTKPEDEVEFELICDVCGEYESECICDLDWDVDWEDH